MNTSKDDWLLANYKVLRHPDNKKFVTGRVNIVNGRKVLYLSLGLEICKAINFVAHDRVHILLHKDDKNILMIRKEQGSYDGYKLSYNKKSNSSFMTFSMRFDSLDSFRLSQTIVLEHDSIPNTLLVNLERLKWKK